MNSITPKELKQLLDSETEIILIDVREQFEYNICHLNNAQLIPLNTLPANLQKIDLAKQVVVYCHHGVRSAYAINYIQQVTGTNNLYNLTGGIDAWANEVDTSMPVY